MIWGQTLTLVVGGSDPVPRSISIRYLSDMLKKTTIALPPDLEVKYQKEVEVLEEEQEVQYTTSFERIGLERGIGIGREQGVQLGGASLLLKQVEAKFKKVPASCVEKINSADAKTLAQWGVNFVKAESIEEIF